MSRLVDLHTHSNASDGTDSPSGLVAKAAAAGLAAVALTDHDTVSGLDEAVEAGRRHPLEAIRGCEIAVATPHGEAHILGLWLPPDLPVLAPALEKLRRSREGRNRLVVEKLAASGLPVTYEEVKALSGGESVGRLHIARLLVQKGVAKSTQEAFATLLGDGKPMHVPRALPTPAQGLSWLRAEGATTVFAHPMLLGAPPEWLEDFTADLARQGLDALEAYHSDHTPEAVRRCVDLAARHALALSGGSDYHGEARNGVTLGRGRGGLRLPASIMDKLKALRRKKNLPLYEE